MILLFSGGMDSYIAWHYLNRPSTLYCDLGHRYHYVERGVAKSLIRTTLVDDRLRMTDFEDDEAHIPLRNAFLILMGALYDSEVAIVCQKGEQDLPDRSPEFLTIIEELLYQQSLGPHKAKVINPFHDMTKAQMVSWYLEQGLPVRELRRTWSCYRPVASIPCHACSACFRRWVAFTVNQVADNMEILKWPGIEVYLRKMKEGKYDPQRTEETFLALEMAGYKVPGSLEMV